MPEIRGLGPVKPHVRAATQEIASRFRVYHIGGFATSGHITNSDHYKGLAIDVMTRSKGTMVAEYALANAARLGITYVIWNRRIWDSRNDRGWEPYTGTNPHTSHVHISFHAQAGSGGAPIEPGGSDLSEREGCLMLVKKLLGM